jgi:hypothetical protein
MTTGELKHHQHQQMRGPKRRAEKLFLAGTMPRTIVFTFAVVAVLSTLCSGFQQAHLGRRYGFAPFGTTTGQQQHQHQHAWARRHRRSGESSLPFTLLKATADTLDDPPSPDTTTTAAAKERLSKAYRVAQYAFGTVAGMIFAMPDRTLTTLLATKWGGAAGFGIASNMCRILRQANDHDRLGSDTYKRLNLGLLGFAGLGLTAVPGEAAFLNSAGAAMVMAGLLTALRLFGTVLAFTGWKRGVVMGAGGGDGDKINDTPKQWLGELVQGTKDTVKGLKVKYSKKALTYRNCLLLVCMGIVSSFMEGLFNMRYQKEFTRTWFEISLQWSAVARLFMIATMIYSLKDAAERDRLTGTTFIEMNVMVGAWALLVGLGQAIYPLGFAAYRGVEMFAFSAPFFLKAYKAQKEKEANKE